MGRHYIEDENGEDVKTSNGERVFWSDTDGDSRPDTDQTVYREGNSVMDDIFGGSSKTDSTYNPSTGKFNE